MDILTHAYTLSQWILFFFIYCFIGWIWECCYVSVRVRKWTNRGFMRGPILPIYGSGAITMLFATLPVKDNIVLTFIVSLVAATILELFTGMAMEAIFKVRYWDYSECFLNYKGHICFKASMTWGTAGVLLVFLINKPIAVAVTAMPKNVSELIALFLTVVTSCDFGASFRTAMDVRELVIRLSESGERQIKRIEKRVDVMAAVYGDELGKLKKEYLERIEELKASSQDRIEELVEGGQEYAVRTLDKLLTLSDGQRRALGRFIDSNPETSSKHENISNILEHLKEFRRQQKSGTIVKKIQKSDMKTLREEK